MRPTSYGVPPSSTSRRTSAVIRDAEPREVVDRRRQPDLAGHRHGVRRLEPEEVVARHDADEPPGVHDRQVMDAAAGHLEERLEAVGAGRHRDQRRRHHVRRPRSPPGPGLPRRPCPGGRGPSRSPPVPRRPPRSRPTRCRPPPSAGRGPAPGCRGPRSRAAARGTRAPGAGTGRRVAGGSRRRGPPLTARGGRASAAPRRARRRRRRRPRSRPRSRPGRRAGAP